MQDGASSQAGVSEGDVLAGKYRIDKVLGVGGMGVVVAAHHIHLDERVAIKFLLPSALGNQEAVARFAREARAAVKIKSEHVVRVSDVGTLENGAPDMVREYREGGDLDAWLKKKGPLPLDQAVEFLLQACEAVAEAHSIGIVHRDLKPANLFAIRRPDGTLSVKVLDFGISKVTGFGSSGPDLGMTKTTAVMGSPLYMSPEQMQSSKNADARSDIWALGIILYELLTGEPAFLADSMPELVVKILQTTPAPVRSKRRELPAGVDAVILKCLEKDRAKRYATVGELARDLVEFGPKRARASLDRIAGILQSAGVSSGALDLPPDSEAPKHPASGTLAAWGQTTPGSFRRTRAVLIAVVGLGVLVAALALFGPGSGREGEKTTAGPAIPEGVASAPLPPAEPAPASPPPVEPVVPASSAATAGTGGAGAGIANAPEPVPAATRPTAKVEPKRSAPSAKSGGRQPVAREPARSPQPSPPAATTPPRTSSAFDDRK